MNRSRTIRTAVVLGSLIFLAIAAFAAAQGPPKVGSGDLVADRIRLMRLNNLSLKDLQAKAKAGDIEAIAVNAETIALNAMHIPLLFPPGSVTEKSRAKPEIWSKRAQFEAAAQNLQTQAEKLRDAARAKDAATTQDLVKGFPKQTCGQCHTPMSDGTSFGPIFRSLM